MDMKGLKVIKPEKLPLVFNMTPHF